MAKKSKTNGNGSSPLSQIQDFYKFMVQQSLETLDYSHEGLHVRMVRRKAASATVHVPVAAIAPGTARAGHEQRAVPVPSPSPTPASGTTIKAPMMGIFYRASTPSSPPFVKNGEAVKKGHVLCLIEAMKVFNEVKADFDCVILENLLDNGKPVKVGQALFSVERK